MCYIPPNLDSLELASRINRSLKSVVYFNNVLEDMADMMCSKTHFRGILGFSGVSDLAFLLIVLTDMMCIKGQYIF